MKTCIKCYNATMSIDTEKFCSKDGARLVENPRCECGAQLMQRDRFCAGCGKAVYVTLFMGEWIDRATADRISKDGP